ncbi:lipopolysaccharide biosynthesis protein [uncultured Fibrobacter sp.]|uniref:lipopolysaccharide biosynthesis protein n=1 Tax=uncultured Fibrobacter sp. TaxID=261512 RepID=UPI0026175094|nr:lipopolysaccharide biosynthesis protein [uncultured Fibrobacter sp.]
MSDILNKKKSTAQIALGGMAWAFAERICAQIVTLIVSIILARLLGPDEYAIVGIVFIFVTIANVFVTAGFGSALVQKLNADNIDFSTTLYFSIGFSTIIYVILFLAAPYIAAFYEIDLLTPVVRVMSLRIIIASINSVQHAYIERTLQFKKFFYSTSIGTGVSAIVGIGMAYAGFGVWALVGQYLSNVIVDTIVLSFTCGWKPSLVFSWNRMKSLYSYGWKVMLATVLRMFGKQARGLVISKVATPRDLSFFNQGEKFPALFINNIETSIQKVMAPILSREQENLPRVLDLTRKTMRISTFTIWPLLIGLAAVSESLIEILYTEKWIGCVPYLKLICVAYMFYPIGETHVRAIKALGRSDVSLKTIFLTESINISMLVIAIFWGVGGIGIVVSWILSSIVMAVLNGIADYKMIKYKMKDQFADIFFTGLCCSIMFFVVNSLASINMNLFLKLLLQVIAGLLIYLISSYLLNHKSLVYVVTIAKNFGRNLKKKSVTEN